MGQAFTRTLLPLDFSPASDAILDVAAYLSVKYGTEIVLAHVIEETIIEHAASGYNVSGLLENVEEEARRRLEAYRDRLEESGARVSVHRDLPVADPAVAVSSIASEEGVSEILIVNKGWGWKRLIPFGSTAKLIIASSPKPVIRVRAVKLERRIILEWPSSPFHSILLAVARDSDLAMADYVSSIAEKAGSEVIVLHVTEASVREPDIIQGVLESLEERGVKARKMVIAGRPHARIIEVSEQLGVTSIAMGRSLKSRLVDVVFGSTLYRVVAEARVPVIVHP
ncbi:MAG: universal stress protein [Desulfurococcales archaeon]|nr:universal stress protein [Desulfurococcales archaeon]